MKIFDLHSHPGFKTIFNNIYNPWDNIPANDFLLSEIIRSQSSLRQIVHEGKCNLVCISLYAPETAFVDQWLVKVVAASLTDALDGGILDNMIAKEFSYQQERDKALSNLDLPPGKPKEIHILKSLREYDPGNSSKLFILFSIEGGHAFYGDKNDDQHIKQILVDFSKFIKNKPGEERLVLYITPSHLTPNIFINHAYGNKMLAKGEFIPRGYGISGNGELFLQRIIDESVLIDVKHMSVFSRKQFYGKKKWNGKPLLASHVGVTGISWDHKLDRKKAMHSIKKGPGFVKVSYTKPNGILKGTLFNPISINLYDEDIVNILKTNGLIAISMDLRIIGGERNLFGCLKLHEKEFVSSAEYNEWVKQNSLVADLNANDFDQDYNMTYEWTNNGEINPAIWDEEDRLDEFEDLNNLTNSDVRNFFSSSITGNELLTLNLEERVEEHLRFFVNQVFHIVSVAEIARLPIDPWKHICIGSDFDGFVRTIDCCRNASELNLFAERLKISLRKLADETLGNETSISLPREPEELIDDIFFKNAFCLMQEHFLGYPCEERKFSKKSKQKVKGKVKSKKKKKSKKNK